MNEEQKKLLDLDLYALLDIDETCNIDQIRKAYRKKALELHPDKNLNNKELAEKQFIELGKVFEILTDNAARSAYDCVRRNKKEREKRTAQLDDKRRKFKEDLESRENLAKAQSSQKTTSSCNIADEERLRNEVERLRKEGSKLLEEEIAFLNEELVKIKKTKKPQTLESILPRFKVTWLNKQFSTELTESLLEHLFSKYGQIEACLLNSKKTSAIVEFKILDDALNALKDEDNLKKKYSIILTWLGPDLNKKKQNKEIPDPILNPEATNDEFSNLTFDEIEAAVLKKLKKN